MVSIAICDDSIETLLHMKKIIYKCFEELECGITGSVDVFSDGKRLLEAAANKAYDLFVLDIIMPGITGLEIAREIMSENTVSAIAFLTSSPEFAIESYDVDALDYIVKPAEKERIKKMLLKFLRRHNITNTEEIIIQSGKTLTRIPLHTLCYAETINHQLVYHTSDGQEINCRQTLAEAEALLLPHRCFVKPHRSYIVNQDFINKISAGCITMKNGDRIWASRSNMKDFAEAYLKYKVDRNGGN